MIILINAKDLLMDSIKRIDWIDVAKGIGIILMVMGHTSMPDAINRWIYSFHMPLFFLLSGLLFIPCSHNVGGGIFCEKSKLSSYRMCSLQLCPI